MVGTSDAFTGISASDKDGIRIVDYPQRFADEVLKFLNSPALRSECGLRGMEFVQ